MKGLVLIVVLLGCMACWVGAIRPYVRDPAQNRFWIISDIHYDSGYTPGTEADCGQPLCCRNLTANSTNPPPIKDPAGKWGNYRCDAPQILVEGILQEMVAIEPNPDFIIWLGDNVKHDIWMQSREENLQATYNCTQFIKQAFPSASVIPIFGNHEAYPTDQFEAPPGMNWLYSALADYWQEWLPKDGVASFLYSGYYQTVTADGLLVVALNMMYCDPLNFYLQNITTPDPGHQLEWFISVLTQARIVKQKVLVISHIPPGMALKAGLPNCLPEYSKVFSSIISNFSDIIVGQLYGHTHEDSFLVFKVPVVNQIPNNFGLVNPSMTPYIGHNPAARLVTYDNQTKLFQNIYTYWADLNATNAADRVIFDLEYEMPSEYNMADLTPKSWQDLAERMKLESDVFDLWHLHYFTMDTNHSCDFLCRRLIICGMQNVGNLEEYSACIL